MILSHLSRKRPYQHLLLTACTFTVFTWLIFALNTTSSSRITRYLQSLNSHTRQAQNGLETSVLGSHVTDTNDSDSPLDGRRPFPDGSKPNFPNVPVAVHRPADDRGHLTEEEVGQYADHIWELRDTRFWRTECEGERRLPKRYKILSHLATAHDTSQIKYYFALDLYNVTRVMPRLMGSLVQAIKMIGPSKCAVSIVEGRSEDGTFAILAELQGRLRDLGVTVYLQRSSINPHAKGGDRIGALSILRNMALAPLLEGATTPSPFNPSIPLYDSSTILNFINDIALCPDDIYELLFQHIHQHAHQTCSMDWTSGGDVFYDGWVSRSMTGDLFFEVPQDVSFAFARTLFWDHRLSRRKFLAIQPFQVFSCWGGMVALDTTPFLSHQIAFRNATKGECYAGEPLTMARDLWRLGYNKIQTVPSINVGYSMEETAYIKRRRGWVHKHINVDRTEDDSKSTELIPWKARPPGQVKCMPSWGGATWTRPDGFEP